MAASRQPERHITGKLRIRYKLLIIMSKLAGEELALQLSWPTNKKKNNAVQTTVSTLRQFVINDLLYASDVGEIAPDDELLGSGMLDSLASAQLMVFIEETYSVKLDPNDLTFENFNTLSALSAMVARHTEQ